MKKWYKINLSEKVQIKEEITSKLIYRQNQLFLINIDNSEKVLTVNKIE